MKPWCRYSPPRRSPAAGVLLLAAGQPVLDETQDLAPENPYARRLPVPPGTTEADLKLRILDAAGTELLGYAPATNRQADLPEAARPALPPAETASNEQLFLTGQHLEQYRHATYRPVPYYEEALRRDPTDARCNNALGLWLLRHGQFTQSEAYLRRAVATLTQRNPNPYDGEAYYNLGLSLKYQNRPDEAYEAFFKATWSSAWQDSAYFAVAQLDLARGHYAKALAHIGWALDRNARNGRAYVVQAAALRKLGQPQKALETCAVALGRDGFNLGALAEQAASYHALGQPAEAAQCLARLHELARADAHSYLEYALDYAAAGLYAEAIGLLEAACPWPRPTRCYATTWLIFSTSQATRQLL